MRVYGTVAHISRYPVKSMHGEELTEADVRLNGIRGDRWYAFVQEGNHSSFPWLTGRENKELLRYKPHAIVGDRSVKVDVTTPLGAVLPVESDELREELSATSGIPVRLHSSSRGNFDAASLSLISTATVRALTEQHGVPPDHRRFRMNLTIEADISPFAEAQLVGSILRVGDVRLAVTDQDMRCQMITLDPDTGEGTPGVLKSAGALNNTCAGVYLAVLKAGHFAVGDEVIVEGA